MKVRTQLLAYILVLVIGGLLSGCLADLNAPTTPGLLEGTPTNTLVSITDQITDTPQPAWTVSPTQTPKVDETTPRPSPTQTMTEAHTITPLPSLTIGESQEKVMELFETNGGCNLPCWWGITPGETTWEIAQNEIQSFSLDLLSSDFGAPPETVIYSAYFKIPEDLYVRGFTTQAFFVREDNIEFIYAHPIGTENYLLPQLLSKYGPPTEVLIRTFKEPREGILPFYLVLFYEDDGFMVSYQIDASISGANIHSCPTIQQPAVWLWNPDNNLSPRNISELNMSRFNSDEFGFYTSLEDAAGLDIVTFYNIFKTSTTSCLETTAEIWPYQH